MTDSVSTMISSDTSISSRLYFQSLMLELCNILGITVNELLSGERIEMKDYMEKSEANIISVMSEEKKRRKRLYVIIDGLLFVFCIVVFLYTRFF